MSLSVTIILWRVRTGLIHSPTLLVNEQNLRVFGLRLVFIWSRLGEEGFKPVELKIPYKK